MNSDEYESTQSLGREILELVRREIANRKKRETKGA
jgi:hypothetical protein